MVKYNFKDIHVVPSSTDFVDIVLSKTQRKTPTVIHARMQIARIRQFYMRKVKFCQTAYNERLTTILEQFPKLDNIHPFYADMINVLYDKDHYKLALGQLNTCRSIIDKIGKDYVKLMKYGDSLFRCKQLKKAALGRMATLMRKQKAPLGYLEQVRQHLSRLPSIDPDERTVLLTGFPNVGKSSFINKITRADVEVQNYAFTTKSLYVGHMDYNYLRWQVIDSPGVLDRPLVERNTIEMQAITALAHLNACIIFILDLDPCCKYSIQEQISLFISLKPLWIKKPVLFVCNKTDLRRVSDCTPEEQQMISNLTSEGMVEVMEMSNLTEENSMDVRNRACDALLAHRLNVKTQTNKLKNISHRMFIAYPEKRDNLERPAFIPPSVRAKRAANAMEVDEEERPTEKDLEDQHGGFGVYNQDMRKFWNLKNPEWKYDAIPEIWNGKNIADFVDSDIMEHLNQLEAEEAEILQNVEAANNMEEDENELSEGEELMYDEIQYQKAKTEQKHKETFARNHAVRPRKIRDRSLTGMSEHLEDLGYEMDTFNTRAQQVKAEAIAKRAAQEEHHRGRSRVRKALDRERDESAVREKSQSKARSKSRVTKAAPGMANIRSTIKSRNLLHRSLRKIGKQGRQGPSDRFIATKMPKHLFTGKRGIGKTDRR